MYDWPTHLSACSSLVHVDGSLLSLAEIKIIHMKTESDVCVCVGGGIVQCYCLANRKHLCWEVVDQ